MYEGPKARRRQMESRKIQKGWCMAEALSERQEENKLA